MGSRHIEHSRKRYSNLSIGSVPDHGNESISEGHREYDYLGWIARLDLLP
jgi:hypothetical protein